MFSKVICNLLVAPGGPKQLPSSVITSERVTQVDLVSQGVAELDAHKLSVPSSLHVLLSTAFRVGIRFEWELSPDGVFACEEIIRCEGLIYCLLFV